MLCFTEEVHNVPLQFIWGHVLHFTKAAMCQLVFYLTLSHYVKQFFYSVTLPPTAHTHQSLTKITQTSSQPLGYLSPWLLFISYFISPPSAKTKIGSCEGGEWGRMSWGLNLELNIKKVNIWHSQAFNFLKQGLTELPMLPLSTVSPNRPWTFNPPPSVTQVARITGLYHVQLTFR